MTLATFDPENGGKLPEPLDMLSLRKAVYFRTSRFWRYNPFTGGARPPVEVLNDPYGLSYGGHSLLSEAPGCDRLRINATVKYDDKTEVVEGCLGQVGDVKSNAKGSGARYNAGKPDFSQFRLDLLVPRVRPVPTWLGSLLNLMSEFQFDRLGDGTSSVIYLRNALDLVPDGLRAAAKVFSYGEKKYARYNWMKGMAWSIPIACIGRHALAIIEGEELDKESGEPHAGHIACNIIMLLHFLDHYPEGDDRPVKPE